MHVITMVIISEHVLCILSYFFFWDDIKELKYV